MATNSNKYLQILSDLKQQIWSQYYQAGQQLPSENELAQTYQVSRITSKRALQELTDSGLVERIQGRGTFVRKTLTVRPRTNQILLVIPFSAETGLGDYITGIKEVLTSHQQSLVVVENKDVPVESFTQLAHQYDGILFYPQDFATELPIINQALLHHLPLVLIDKTATNFPLPAVVADNAQGGYLATNTLIERGHQKIAFLSHSPLTTALNSSAAQRYFGYLRALSEHGLNFTTDPLTATEIVAQDFTNLVPFLTANQVSAVVCENDVLALRLLPFLAKQNITVPEQLSVIGFDNINQTATSSPQLTTIQQNFHEIGRQAANLLQARIDNPYAPQAPQLTVPVELMQRASVTQPLLTKH
ncbi:GntR family transcriptional regulator [Latilactobacillus curvatus]|uniref:GntR family transcriptional regulator n=1 Tax=Latilactobacillus curvatus TaxID=28038 RepID=UPI000FECA596|nr:LacI family DNA-binding transcriptional regulator [Latilactobacillus curvatus]QAR34624.1 LacI family transcriptional regulator [Latilactobacillus curvatus]